MQQLGENTSYLGRFQREILHLAEPTSHTRQMVGDGIVLGGVRGNEHFRFGGGDKPLQIRGAETYIQRYRNRTDLVRRDEGVDVLGSGRQNRSNPIATLNAETKKGLRESICGLIELAERYRLPTEP